ncbi:hypothetical protein AS9A_4154 [Hoyosella subflava DQS3-9A1]|uniref:Uncharacterized protein n=1 Tax=Hoyosella subflava (strain DSM 45089 / JCM 17490 / NBRC 109087 / DQS3-9A1) TaxID=443218 RepID=F6EK48_HOYSD|nr:hypothetical protein AS9A_4154 [Hoyosella subflava DQS3-9A1]
MPTLRRTPIGLSIEDLERSMVEDQDVTVPNRTLAIAAHLSRVATCRRYDIAPS